jgi:hypothetical protein
MNAPETQSTTAQAAGSERKARGRFKPVIVLPPDQMSREDINELRTAGFCVVEAKDPSLVRFIEPPVVSVSDQERAALSLCRMLANPSKRESVFSGGTIAASLCDLLLNDGRLTPVAPVPSVTANPPKR